MVGTRVGAYEIVAKLGEGGMGEVYRARDVRLNRDVALKTLPVLLADDPDRLQRFKREAHVLASLNHANIAAIYGLEDCAGTTALVLELVEGPTLADRIAQGPMPMDEAWPIARQIAEALEAAHEQGIIHRDLKPANIKVRPDGTVKVLDFGLAKALQPTAMSGSVAMSPTITSPAMTQMGIILGTAAYMSPEQAKARAVDKRSDIWAFGAVFYEMLSGTRAFSGDDIPDVLASVLRQDIDWNALPPSVPAPVRRLIARCLERDEKRRLRDIGEARILLDGPFEPGRDAVAAPQRPLAGRAVALVLATAVGAILGTAAAWFVWRTPPTAPPVVRLAYPLPSGQSFNRPNSGHSIALSRDGERIVYTANNRLYVRTLSENEDRVIGGTETFQLVSSPAFSPDGRSIVFFAASDRTLRRIALSGGRADALCTISTPYGINWADDGILVGQAGKGIIRVPSGGGAAQVVLRVKEDEEAHGPQLLPDGRHVLFTIASGTDPDKWDRARIVVQALDSETPRTLVEGGTDARFEPVTGQILYADSERLLARPFDARSLAFTGDAVPLAGTLMRAAARFTGAVNFAVSSRTLIYVNGPPSLTAQDFEIRLTSRGGSGERVSLPAARYSTPRVSPDGTQLALGVRDGDQARIGIFELSGTRPLRMLTLAGNSRFPVWSRDGRRLTFQSDREGDLALFEVAADGSTLHRLTKPAAGQAHEPEEWSPTQDVLLFSVIKNLDVSLWTYASPGGNVAPFGDVHSIFPTGARFSRNGRWVAYSSRGRDRGRIFVRAFPNGRVEELPISGNSVTGNTIAAHKIGWAADDSELFYIPSQREFEAVQVTTQPDFRFGQMTKVPRPFENPGAPNMRTQYDITPSGKFVGLFPPGDTGQNVSALLNQIEVVLNWTETLKVR